MRALFVLRLYSGFEKTFKSGTWNPGGAPAIYKLIEHIDKNKNIDKKIIFLPFNDNVTKIYNKHINTVKIEGINSIFTILKYRNNKLLNNKFELYVNRIIQLISIIFYALKYRPEIIYIDRSNIIVAAFLHYIYSANIIVRVLGVTPEMHRIQERPRIFYEKILLYAYGLSYKKVICTEDGSGVYSWITKVGHINSEINILLNGVDKKLIRQAKGKSSNGKIRIIFPGRIERLKGIYEFVSAISKLSKATQEKIEVLIVGKGSEEFAIKKTIDQAGIGGFVNMTGNISHSEMYSCYVESDIYVSLNQQGSLSNTTLEALSSGLVCLLLSPDAKSSVDITTSQIFPDSIVPKINRENIVYDLVDKLEHIVNDDEVRGKIMSETYKLANKKISTWDARINNEINIIERMS